MRPHRESSPAPRLVRAVAALGLAGSVLLLGPVAVADAPLDLTTQVTDRASALGGDAGKVTDRLDELANKDGIQLYVAFVESFDGQSGKEWAQETYDKSGLGGNDVLLAVATKDRRYGTGAPSGSALSRELPDIMARKVEPELRSGDWAGAATAAADGLARVDGGGSSSGSGSGGAGVVPLVIGGGVVLVAGGALLMSRRRKKAGTQTTAGPATVPAAGGGPQDTTSGRPESPEEVGRRAAASLVALDDAVRSSTEELQYAQAQFGTQATTAFRQALEQARARSVEAFKIQQQLDDGAVLPADRLGAHQRILALATEADELLDRHQGEFERMRDLQSKVPQLLTELTTRVAETRSRLPVARQQLDSLQATYPEPALRTVRSNVDQAGRLVEAAEQLVGSGREHLSGEDRPAAVVSARGAEDALGQASSLLDAVDRAHVELPRAAQALEDRLASITSDVADAQRLHADDAITREALTAAHAAIARGKEARTGGDPLGALAELDRAEHDLDNALQSYRDADEQQQRVKAGLEEKFARARARLLSIDDTIRTRRGAVGRDARTRISEALRLYDEAVERSATDPQGALSLLTQAEQLGEDALRLAEDDYDGWGGHGGWGGRRGGFGIDPTSMILGGILMGGGGHHHDHGGGWGGGSGGWGGSGGFGGDFGGGGFGGGGDFGGGSF